jgi:hypothetical protein
MPTETQEDGTWSSSFLSFLCTHAHTETLHMNTRKCTQDSNNAFPSFSPFPYTLWFPSGLSSRRQIDRLIGSTLWTANYIEVVINNF